MILCGRLKYFICKNLMWLDFIGGCKNVLLHRVLIENILLFLNVFLNIKGGIISNDYI
jgi:hypothetical protein